LPIILSLGQNYFAGYNKRYLVGKSVSVKKILRYGMAIVAGIFLVVAIVKIYQFLQLSTDGLYREVFVNYQLPLTNDTSLSDRAKIEDMYRKKNFKAIIAEAKRPRVPDDKTFLLIGISYLETNDPFNAIATFRQIKPTGDYKQEAQYYLSLAYLRNNDYDQALGLMQQIKNNKSHGYHEHFSSSFLDKIRMLKWK